MRKLQTVRATNGSIFTLGKTRMEQTESGPNTWAHNWATRAQIRRAFAGAEEIHCGAYHEKAASYTRFVRLWPNSIAIGCMKFKADFHKLRRWARGKA